MYMRVLIYCYFLRHTLFNANSSYICTLASNPRFNSYPLWVLQLKYFYSTKRNHEQDLTKLKVSNIPMPCEKNAKNYMIGELID